MNLNPNNQISLELKTALTNMFDEIGIKKVIPKNTVILKEGATCDFFFYVVEGIFRAYRFVDDREVTIGFSFQGDIDTCPYSYVNNLVSLDIIHAANDAKIIKVNKKDYLAYIQKSTVDKSLTEFFLSHYIEILVQRTISMRLYTAEQNYLNLLKRSPQEVGKIPLSWIASYLGISSERLSRIRKKNLLI